MRIVVAGDRAWRCGELATAILRRLVKRYGASLTIVHGGQNGVDESFDTACKNLGTAVEVRLPNWPNTGLPTIGNNVRPAEARAGWLRRRAGPSLVSWRPA